MRHVTLLIPSYRSVDSRALQAIANALPELPGLDLILNHSVYSKKALDTDEIAIAQLILNDNSSRSILDIAPYTYFMDAGVTNPGWYMRADPVNLQPDRDQLVLAKAGDFGIAMEEALSIGEDINNLFGNDPWEFRVPHPQRWYIVSAQDPQINTRSKSSVVGESIDKYLPTGKQQRYWRAILNEMQMLLHNHPVNVQRRSKDLIGINSLWLWGNGQLTAKNAGSLGKLDSDAPWQCVYSDDSVCQALAKSHGMELYDLPAQALDIVAQAGNSKPILCSLNSQLQINGYDPYDWQQWLLDIEQKWFSPLLASLNNKRIDCVSIIFSSGSQYRLTKPARNRWWKNNKPWYTFSL